MRLLLCIACLLLPLSAPALEIGGVPYLTHQEVGEKLGLKARWLTKGERLQLESSSVKLVLVAKKREVKLNGVSVYMGFPVAVSKGRLCVSQSDYQHHLRPILAPQYSGPVPALRHIVIDPGHGGKDPGAEKASLKLREKALTLDLAKRLQRLLQAKGFKVTLTRDDDTFLSLDERAARANRLKADLFVSLHFNAIDAAEVRGVETYAFTPPNQPSTSRSALQADDRKTYPANADGAWSTLAGYHVQRGLASGLKANDRGLKRARFRVLRDLQMPGVLVEGGFLTNASEGKSIGSPDYRERMARAIADGVANYKTMLERAGKPGRL